MALTAEQYKALIVSEVGDDAAGTIAAGIDIYWELYESYTDSYTRYLHTKRKAIDVLLGRVRQQVSFKALDGASVDLSDLFDHLMRMREATQKEIDEGLSSNSAAAIGDITQTAPVMAPDGSCIDANDRAYRGDPYRTRTRRV